MLYFPSFSLLHGNSSRSSITLRVSKSFLNISNSDQIGAGGGGGEALSSCFSGQLQFTAFGNGKADDRKNITLQLLPHNIRSWCWLFSFPTSRAPNPAGRSCFPGCSGQVSPTLPRPGLGSWGLSRHFSH